MQTIWIPWKLWECWIAWGRFWVRFYMDFICPKYDLICPKKDTFISQSFSHYFLWKRCSGLEKENLPRWFAVRTISANGLRKSAWRKVVEGFVFDGCVRIIQPLFGKRYAHCKIRWKDVWHINLSIANLPERRGICLLGHNKVGCAQRPGDPEGVCQIFQANWENCQ